MIFKLGLSVVVLGILFVLSLFFNSYIDSRDDEKEEERFDGETAVWVGLGVFYTCVLGIGGLASIWGGWKMGQYAVVVALISFMASGAPMGAGDIYRSLRRRTQ